MAAIAKAALYLGTSTLLAAATLAPVHAQSSLAFISEPGDPIGQGRTRTFRDAAAGATDGYEAIYVEAFDDNEWYRLEFFAPQGDQLRKGRYDNAVRVIWGEAASKPGLHFYGNNRSCTRVDGRFEITEIRYGAFGYIEKLRANFEQRCNGSKATVYGDVVVDNPPKPPMMKYWLELGPKAVLDFSQGDSLQPRFTVRCQYRTGGRFMATITQRKRDGSVAQTAFEEKIPCDPKGTTVNVPLSGYGFEPGKATFSVETAIEDPNYSEFETDAAIVKRRTRTVQIVPPCTRR